MNQSKKDAPDYGNWIPMRLLLLVGSLGAVFLIAALFYWLLIVVAALLFGVLAYFIYARHEFSPTGRKILSQVHDAVITNLNWSGQGRALDIGCGNAPLVIRIAKKFPAAKVVGIDYWGDRWEFSKSACERNTQIEGVADRVTFQKASAENLPFEDGYFDAVVSNLVFHEVMSVKNKQDLIKEALRVTKKGGKFSLQDLFVEKKIYGEIDDLLSIIKSWGVEDVQYVDTRNQGFVPKAFKPRFMLGSIGIICGTK